MGSMWSNQFEAKSLYNTKIRCEAQSPKLVRFVAVIFCILIPIFFTGCIYHEITNMTPGTLTRNTKGLYPVHIIWESNDNAIRHDTIKPVVLIGTNSFEMKRTPLMKNRWETPVPIGQVANELRYRIKVNWKYNTIPVPAANSQLSEEFLLRINN
jgi:hypothetical protein